MLGVAVVEGCKGKAVVILGVEAVEGCKGKAVVILGVASTVWGWAGRGQARSSSELPMTA